MKRLPNSRVVILAAILVLGICSVLYYRLHSHSRGKQGGAIARLSEDKQYLTVTLNEGVEIQFNYVPPPSIGHSAESSDRADVPPKEGRMQWSTGGYYLQKYELSCDSWKCFQDAGGYLEDRWWTNPLCHRYSRKESLRGWGSVIKTNGYEHEPVHNVSYCEAQAFANWLSAQTGLDFRLPSQWEWEHAADPSATKSVTPSELFVWGDAGTLGQVDSVDLQQANLGFGSSKEKMRAKVRVGGSYPLDRSWCGQMDMVGNLQEWVIGRNGKAALKGGWYASAAHEFGSSINPLVASLCVLSYTFEDANPTFDRYAAGLRLVLGADEVHSLAAHQEYAQ